MARKITATNTSKPRSSAKGSTKKTAPARSSATARGRTQGKTVAKAVSGSSTVKLKVGQKAPAFSLPDQDGRIKRLSDFTGKKVVLYCYPKDDTPGCTKESCDFRDGLDEIHDHGAVVLGISADSVASHKKFAKKFTLKFPLLSDEEKITLRAYGVWKEKSLYGRKFMGIERTTFIINEQGKIENIFQKVKVSGHLEEVLAELDMMP
ncbi:MAG: thioredoxin-dependent thiol peroxidase [Nitrospira sp.]|nr:thioredoxin-dependent thiol peroxidase [Nitrospira sp.]